MGAELGILKLNGKEIVIFGIPFPVDDVNILTAYLVGSYVAQLSKFYLEPGIGLGLVSFSGSGDGTSYFGVSPRISGGVPITNNIDLKATIPFNFVTDADGVNFWGFYVGGVYRFGE